MGILPLPALTSIDVTWLQIRFMSHPLPFLNKNAEMTWDITKVVLNISKVVRKIAKLEWNIAKMVWNIARIVWIIAIIFWL